MQRTLFTVSLAAGILFVGGCGGGPSDKDQATKVALAFRKASLFDDYETLWKLHPKTGYYGKWTSAEAYADQASQYDKEHPSPPSPWPSDTKFTVEAVAQQTIQQGNFYRVRIRSEAKAGSLHLVDDVLVGKYGGRWLIGGGPVAPGESANVEPTR